MIKHMRKAGIAALAPYIVLSQSALPIAAGAADVSQKSRMLIAEAKSADSSYAASGVKLLHEIFLKLRNSNQLALNNPTKQLTAATQAFSGALNPLLAIRPAEKSLSQSQSLAYASQDKKVYEPRGLIYSSELKATKESARKKAQASPASNAAGGAMSVNSGLSSNSANVREETLDNLSPQNAPQPATISLKADMRSSSSAKARRGVAMVADREGQVSPQAQAQAQSAPAAGGGLSPQNSQMLAKSVARLMQSTRQMSELSQAGESSIHTFGKAKTEVRDERTISTRPGGPVIQEYGDLQSRSAGKDAMLVSNGASVLSRADADQPASAPLMIPAQPGQYKYFTNQLMALLPPSVVGGIPLARLGATEQELQATLNKKNSATRQVIDDWTVWTLKNSSGHQAAVQLYMRHKVLEAIRVFQPMYLGDEVGIKIGDDLQAIKSKFGEPAFILSEPDLAGRGSPSQNYVYPISHVAFQLARAKSQPSPQVVSVLIFDVQ